MSAVDALAAYREVLSDLRDAAMDLEAAGMRIERSMLPPRISKYAWKRLEECAALLDNPDALRFEKFPDGTNAHPPFTVRQVELLYRPHFKALDHTDARYAEILSGVRALLGRRAKTRCTRQTRSGSQCCSFALPYSPEVACRQHAPDAAVKAHKRLMDRETEMFHTRLTEAGMEIPA